MTSQVSNWLWRDKGLAKIRFKTEWAGPAVMDEINFRLFLGPSLKTIRAKCFRYRAKNNQSVNILAEGDYYCLANTI